MQFFQRKNIIIYTKNGCNVRTLLRGHNEEEVKCLSDILEGKKGFAKRLLLPIFALGANFQVLKKTCIKNFTIFSITFSKLLKKWFKYSQNRRINPGISLKYMEFALKIPAHPLLKDQSRDYCKNKF